MVAAMGAVLAKLTFMIFGRFHFHFFERQHNNYRQLSANDCNEEIINTFSNKTKQTSKKYHYNYY